MLVVLTPAAEVELAKTKSAPIDRLEVKGVKTPQVNPIVVVAAAAPLVV